MSEGTRPAAEQAASGSPEPDMRDPLSLIGAPSGPEDTNGDGPRADHDADPGPGASHDCDVLIADDTGASRELLAAILRNFAGFVQVREARNGTEALALWQELNPRITLLDIDMPGRDGLSVLQQMRQQRPDAYVAMVSGGSSAETVRKALSLGASGYVVKPYKPQRILDLLVRYRERTGHDLMR